MRGGTGCAGCVVRDVTLAGVHGRKVTGQLPVAVFQASMYGPGSVPLSPRSDGGVEPLRDRGPPVRGDGDGAVAPEAAGVAGVMGIPGAVSPLMPRPGR